MGPDESDVASPIGIIDCDDQAVLVSAEVEDYPVLSDDARVRVDAFYVRRRPPVRFPDVVIPSP